MKTLSILATAAVVIFMTLLSGCGGKSATTIIVAPDYTKQFAINAVLAVVIADDAPEIIYFGDVKKSLGEAVKVVNEEDITGEMLVWDYFINRIVIDIINEVHVKSAFTAKIGQKFRITREQVVTAEEDIAVIIPERGTRIDFDTAEVALVLFLDKIRLGTETDPFYLERAQGGINVRSGRRLIYLASFVLWDNRMLAPICYGRVKTTVPIIRPEATIANWEEVSRNFVRTIFEPTGFIRNTGRKR